MPKNRLYTLFGKLDAEELRQLDKYLQSPLFNRREELLRLFRYLRNKPPKHWTDEKLMAELYPGEQPEVQQLHHARSFLLKHIEDYLVWKESHEPLRQHLMLMRAYRRKRWEKGFRRQLRELGKGLKSSPRRNMAHHELAYEMQQERYRHQSEKGRTQDFNLQELSDAQDLLFMAGKLRDACNIVSHQAVTKKEYDLGLLPAVLQRICEHPHYLEHPAIALYYHAYMAQTTPDGEEHFHALKEGLRGSGGVFSKSERKDLFLLANNYCIRRINTSQKAYIREAFELYRQGMEGGVYLEEGILSKWTYNNVIILGLNLGEFDWTEDFIQTYKDILPPEVREDSYLFNWAKFHFEKGDYTTAMPLLLQSKFDDQLHNLGAKTMLAKMYYELEEWDALGNHLDSFQQYLHRHGELGYHKENYLNFIAFVRKLMAFPNKEFALALAREIQETRVLTEKAWLLQQCGEEA